MLSALRLQLERVETEEHQASEKAHMSLRSAKDMLDHVATDVRNLSHILMPTSLGKFGLKKAVEIYVEQLNHAGKIHFDLLITGFEQPLPEQLSLSTYRILLELCNNILKHAEARNVIIQLVEHEDQLVIMVEDNGKGFEPIDRGSEGIGLRTIESRIHLMRGRMIVETAPGQGTLISIELPLKIEDN
jgi:signal transduction histidine kinase